MKAIVNVPICALLAAPTRESTLEDEALYGMVVDILEEAAPGWVRVRTHYRYEGYAPMEQLIVGDEAARAWEAHPKRVVRNKNCCDALSIPKVQGCARAIEKGVSRVHILNGTIPHPIILEIFTDKGIGTMVHADDDAERGTKA